MEGDGCGTNGTMLPPGFRFHPTDEELLTCYLISKISHPNSTGAAALVDVDLNKCEPWDLPGKAKIGEKEWYFFSHRDRKYPTGVRTNRATKTGYWKTTGKDKEIFNSITSELIGMKKTLVFYRGRAPRGEKTNWVMHEFRLHSKPTFPSAKEEWVICRVFQKSGTPKKCNPSYELGIGALIKNPESFVLGSSSFGGLKTNTTVELGAMIPALKLPQNPTLSNAAASSNFTGSPFDAEMGYVEEPNIANNGQSNGRLGFEHSVDLHTYWTSFLLN
ncbi:protein CUP-SHAPED COTYLEDON 2-like [Punica granatum]|uniref:Protein CUP-SHAPED COTYLEDON 2-like n=1 Tax=Punica granatum TaxID=22663 RepID=A0A218WYG5_PUNGR|nr:protein CUP-SHAPED COTYLEDON 2-like [Punica granatum]OWM77251.1 hypothetical protein CDL15_Pgr028888 [Punica granatum]